jgi:hypothetical protein
MKKIEYVSGVPRDWPPVVIVPCKSSKNEEIQDKAKKLARFFYSFGEAQFYDSLVVEMENLIKERNSGGIYLGIRLEELEDLKDGN